MMNKPLVVYRLGCRGFQAFYTARVQEVWIGLGKSRETEQQYPAIELMYPSSFYPRMLQIAEEMQAYGIHPSVHIVPQGRIEVIVLFRYCPSDFKLLGALDPDGQMLGIIPFTLGKIEVVATAEADFERGSKGIRMFLENYKKRKFFNLFLLDPTTKIPSWGVELEEMEQTFPSL